MPKVNYLSRWFASYFLYIVFGIGGLMISLFAYPILLLLVRNPVQRSHYGQYLIYLCFKSFTFLMKLFGICTIEIVGMEKLREQDLFIITNHPTLIDVVILLSVVKRCDCVVKAKLMDNPFTKGPLKVAAYIVNASPEQLIESCVNALNKKHSLLMFPEGTRTKNMDELHFKRGAAKIAIKAKKDMTPIVIKCQPRMLGKEEKWYKIPDTKPHFTIEVGNKILVQEFLDINKSENIQSRNLNNHLVKYFKEELQIA